MMQHNDTVSFQQKLYDSFYGNIVSNNKCFKCHKYTERIRTLWRWFDIYVENKQKHFQKNKNKQIENGQKEKLLVK